MSDPSTPESTDSNPDLKKGPEEAVECCQSQPGGAKEDPNGAPKKGRRDFLLGIGVALNVVAGAMIGIPIIGYVLSAFVKKPQNTWFSLGPTSQFPKGQTRMASFTNTELDDWSGETRDTPCWVRHLEDGTFQVFAIHCTHLGCPVRWFNESKLFMCPCHGGVYYEDGSRASGPPPRGLYTYKHEIKDGNLRIYAGEIPSLANPKA